MSQFFTSGIPALFVSLTLTACSKTEPETTHAQIDLTINCVETGLLDAKAADVCNALEQLANARQDVVTVAFVLPTKTIVFRILSHSQGALDMEIDLLSIELSGDRFSINEEVIDEAYLPEILERFRDICHLVGSEPTVRLSARDETNFGACLHCLQVISDHGLSTLGW